MDSTLLYYLRSTFNHNYYGLYGKENTTFHRKLPSFKSRLVPSTKLRPAIWIAWLLSI